MTNQQMETSEQKKSVPIVNYVALALLIVLLGFTAFTLLGGPQKLSKKAPVVPDPPLQSDLDNQEVSATIEDGVQVAQLGWGKFNYAPSVIHLKKGIPAKIIADPNKLQGCFRSLVIPDMGIQFQVTKENSTLEFTPQKEGTFTFSCSMGMGSGKIVVA